MSILPRAKLRNAKPEDMPRLLPCPHCGGQAVHRRTDGGDCWVRCSDLSACGAETKAMPNAKEAAARWNRRCRG